MSNHLLKRMRAWETESGTIHLSKRIRTDLTAA